MPIPTETMRPMDRMNRWFAAGSVVLLAALFWLIKVDYDRPWRAIQRDYSVAQAALAHLDYVDSQREEKRKEIEQARRDLAAALQIRDAGAAGKQAVEERLFAIETQHEDLFQQLRAAVTEAARATIAYEAAKDVFDERDPTRAERQNQAKQAEAAVETIKSQIATVSPEWRELRKQVEAHPSRKYLEQRIQEAVRDADAAKIPFSKRDALLKVTQDEYEKVRAAFSDDDPRTAAIAAKLREETDEFTQLRLAKDEADDVLANLKKKLKQLDAEVTVAQKKLDGLLKTELDAKKKYEQYSDRLVREVINAPLLDFTAPKGTPQREQVNQLVLPEVRQRLNYLESYTTDRCTTCHVAIDQKEFTLEALTRRFETVLPAINEKRTAEGAANLPFPAPPPVKDRKPEEVEGKVHVYWSVIDRAAQKRYFNALLATVNRYLDDAGLKQIELGPALWAHPDLDLYTHVDSPHPMATMGCTVCHEGNPQETDFVNAAHTPKTHDEEHEWAEKYYITSAGLPNVDFHTIQHYWDRPMLQPKHTEASCAKCHTQINDVSRFEFEPVAQRINLGRELFTKVGCINCHVIDVEGFKDARKVGPELRQVAAKLERKFVEQWIYNPKKFRPSTWMPHLFMQENNRPGSENSLDPDPVLRTETEVSAIAHYLFTLSHDWQPKTPEKPDLMGDAKRGRELFKSVGCLACHGNLAEYAGQWIPKHIARTEGISEERAEHQYKAMTYDQQALYAMEHFPDDLDAALLPERIVPRPDDDKPYTPPVFTRHAPDLSAIGSKVSKAWLFSWLKEPAHYFENTRMPRLRLEDPEALDLAEYLLTLKHEAWDPQLFPQDEAHQKKAGDLIFQILSGQRSARRSRAIMDDEGGELTDMLKQGVSKSDYAADAKARIEKLSPADKKWLFLGSKMISHYGCYACHKITGFEDATPPGTELTAWAERPIGQLDFAFYDTAFEDMRESPDKKAIFEMLYPESDKDLIRWAHGNEHEEITHTHAAFAYHKLRNPRIWDREKIKGPYDKLKMPNFYFTPEQADALVTFLLSRKPPRVTEKLAVDYAADEAGPITHGRHLTRELNCVGCHQIENNVSAVHQYVTLQQGGKTLFDEVNAPPSLRGEGAKIQHDWLFGFLNEVEMLRPWLKLRMPSFKLTEEEAKSLVAYLAELTRNDAEQLEKRLKGVHEYVKKVEEAVETKLAQGDDGAGEKPAGDRLPLGRDWFQQPGLASAANYLADFAVERRLAKQLDFDPRTSGPEDWPDAYHKVRQRTEFIQKVYDVPYPFTDPPKPQLPQERFELGEKMLMELKCLSCHVLGDPNLPGSNPTPSAPNLDLAYRRLRRDWVRQWVQEPAWIQPGTKMPQMWETDRSQTPPVTKSAFVAQAPDKRTALEAIFGTDPHAQIELLLDYLYDAGRRNHTAVQPVDPNAPAAPRGGDAPELFEEGDEEKGAAAKPGEPELFKEEDEPDEPPKKPPPEKMEFDEPE